MVANSGREAPLRRRVRTLLAVGATVLLTAVAAVFIFTRPINRVTAYCLLTE